MSANLVARELGYPGGELSSWSHYEEATEAAFRPIESFPSRFEELLDIVQAAGFTSLDLWSAHLHYLWATPEHVEITRKALAKRNLRVTSYAGGFGNSLATFRACCRLVSSLGIPILGGSTPLLNTDRAGLVNTLREFGLLFALENHAESSPEELLQKLGEGDEDVLKVAVDTGWFATQGYPAEEALRQLLPRVAIVHLKDVTEPGEHRTCRFGQGVVAIGQCLDVLQQGSYLGPISLEHEPLDHDPTAECQAMRTEVASQLTRRKVAGRRRVRVGIVGCGNIAEAYGRQLSSYPEIALHAVTDLNPARARAFERQFGPRAYASLDGFLADPDVELIVNLTTHSAHYQVLRNCLESERHVYTEKPLALTFAQAQELVVLAAEKGRRLGSAPSTWLGEAQQTAWKLILEGKLGTPRVAYAEVNWGRIETWHPNPAPFYEVGPVFDVAVYPITLLTAWFGPVKTVLAGGGILLPQRTTAGGQSLRVQTEDWSVAILTFEGGFQARLTSSFYVGGPETARGLEVHGDLGSLYLDRWDQFDSRVRLAASGQAARPVPLQTPAVGGIEFARGVRDMARSILMESPHRCTGLHASHVVEVCEAIHASMRSGQKVKVISTFPKPLFPEPL